MTATRRWVLLTALGCVAVLAVGWIMLLDPRRTEAASLRADVEASAEATARLRTQLVELTAQAQELPAQRARLAEIATRLPDNPALPPLIRQLTALADRSGVVLVSLAPLAPTVLVDPAAVPVTAPVEPAAPVEPGAEVPAAAAAPPAGLPLAAVTLTVEVVGDFYSVQSFVDGLEDLQRAFLVAGFALTPGEAPAPADAPAPGLEYTGNLRLTLTGRVFLSPPDLTGATGVVTTLPGGLAPAAPEAPAAPAAPADPAAPAPAVAAPAAPAEPLQEPQP